MMNFWRNLILSAAVLLLSLPSFAQKKTEQVDSLVNLLSAQSMELIEKHGVSYRKVTGPARFLHNNTYLLCDTALWNVNRKEIEAIGNVKILQNSTVLTSEKLTYLIDEDLAQFRGNLVQLEDKDHNVLRTRYLDYNTKDSVAIFRNGASMKDKEGQVIESQSGTYDSKIKTFTFTDNVNMFTDSIFVKTTRIEYHSDRNFATFSRNTDVWKDDDMLSADDGWYDRNKEIFFFRRNVHGMTKDQEGWSDSLFFWRNTLNVEMLGNVQVMDTTRNATALSGRLEYIDSLSRVTLTRDPAVVAVTDSTGAAKDTVYVGADVLRLWSVMKGDIAQSEVSHADQRKNDINADAIGAYRKKAYEDALKAAENAKKENEDYQIEQQARQNRELREAGGNLRQTSNPPATTRSGPPSNPPSRTGRPAPAAITRQMPADSLGSRTDSLSAVRDSLTMVPSLRDSLSAATVAVDSLAGNLAVADSMAVVVPKDTTKIGFIEALGRVRLYREDSQMACDTLRFNELDSLVRLYKEPVVWNEGNRQYAADSIYVSFGDNNLDRAYLMSNAFVTVEEASNCYDQIRSAEMLAFFDDEGSLRRFDALGTADAIFYLKEDSTFATVNKSQAKLLSALFKDGEIESVSYFDQAKNDAWPLAQMSSDDRLLKGFNWQPEKRPAGPEDIVVYKKRPSERKAYAARPRTRFRYTDVYFPGYMDGVYKQIAENEKRAQQRKAREDSLAALPKPLVDEKASISDLAAADSTGLGTMVSVSSDSLSVRDSLSVGSSLVARDSLGVRDSLAVAIPDSLSSGVKSVSDSVGVKPMTEKELAAARKAAQRKEREVAAAQKAAAKAAKQAVREAEWARLDSLDAAKAAAKAEVKAEKERQKKLKTILADRKQAEKDAAKLERYRLRYEQRLARKQEAAKVEKPSKSGKSAKKDDSPVNPDGIDKKKAGKLEESAAGLSKFTGDITQ